MALRLIETTLKKKDNVKISKLLKKFNVVEHIQIQLVSGEVLNRILLEAKRSEEVLDLLDKQFEYRIDFHSYNDLELELLEKYGKELSLSEQGMKQISEYLAHVKALCEKTKDKPPFMYE